MVIVPPKTDFYGLLYIDNKSVCPIINNRQIQAKDGQSIVLGRLVDEESRNYGTSVPIIKDISLIGSLFGSTSDREINNQY
ncbi:hypothetical protein DAT36_14365 [Photobacterium phosphoreum]|nr:hypothetical protein DAT36_14365 [Photobacterium phosphoreum]